METALPALVVTGASSGLGLATARAFLHRGYRVFGSVRTPADAAPEAALHHCAGPMVRSWVVPRLVPARVLDWRLLGRGIGLRAPKR